MIILVYKQSFIHSLMHLFVYSLVYLLDIVIMLYVLIVASLFTGYGGNVVCNLLGYCYPLLKTVKVIVTKNKEGNNLLTGLLTHSLFISSPNNVIYHVRL